MHLDRFKQQHLDILQRIDTLRLLSHAGVEGHAEDIARHIVAMSGTIKLHLAAEDQALYPALQREGDPALARMGQQYQHEMAFIARDYDGFVRRWNTAAGVRADAAGFRADANLVLRRVYERMQREDREFYPRIEALEALEAVPA